MLEIDLAQGKSADYRTTIGQVVYEAMKATLNVPNGDHFQVIAEHPGESFEQGARELFEQAADLLKDRAATAPPPAATAPPPSATARPEPPPAAPGAQLPVPAPAQKRVMTWSTLTGASRGCGGSSSKPTTLDGAVVHDPFT